MFESFTLDFEPSSHIVIGAYSLSAIILKSTIASFLIASINIICVILIISSGVLLFTNAILAVTL
jgi:hypothetical protein